MGKSAICQKNDCTKHASYNWIGTKKRLYCTTCKDDGMIIVKSNMFCEQCHKVASYGLVSDNKRIRCTSHKSDDMENLVPVSCKELGCKSKASYNFDTEKKPLFCNKHKDDTMINLSEPCQFPMCRTVPIYNEQGEKKGKFCKDHKTDVMVRVIGNHCMSEGCPKIAKFGDKSSRYCFDHKSDDMLDYRSKQCISCTNHRAIKKFENQCLQCYSRQHPEIEHIRNHRTKELLVYSDISKSFAAYNFISDKRIHKATSRYRPDIFLRLDDRSILIEVDEFAHDEYNEIYEDERTLSLYNDNNREKMIVLRFNPDNYDHVSSCFGLNEYNNCVVKNSKVEEWKERLDLLKERIAFWLDDENVPEEDITIEKLFYDTVI